MYHELINKVTELYGHDEAIQRIKAHREAHNSTLYEALAAVAAQSDQPVITEEQIRTTILILDTLTMGALQTDDALMERLERAIEAAYAALGGDIECEVEDQQTARSA